MQVMRQTSSTGTGTSSACSSLALSCALEQVQGSRPVSSPSSALFEPTELWRSRATSSAATCTSGLGLVSRLPKNPQNLRRRFTRREVPAGPGRCGIRGAHSRPASHLSSRRSICLSVCYKISVLASRAFVGIMGASLSMCWP